MDWAAEKDRLQRDLEEARAQCVETMAFYEDQVKQTAALRERAEGLERERQHAVDALQRCDEDREVLRERAERAEVELDSWRHMCELKGVAINLRIETIATLTQERDALLLESGDAHRRAGRGQGSSRALFPADPKKADHK